MMRKMLGVFSILLLLAACRSPISNVSTHGSGRSISLSWHIGSSGTRSIMPASYPSPSNYTVVLSNQGIALFSQTVSGTSSSYTFNNLSALDYSISVTGTDSSGNVLVGGSGDANLTSLESTVASIPLVYITTGTGTGQIHLTFAISGVSGAVGSMVLVDPSGTVSTPTLEGSSPTYSYDNISAAVGSYKLFLKLTTATQTAIISDTILVAQNVSTTATVTLTSADFTSTYVAVTSLSLNTSSLSLSVGGIAGFLTATLSPATASDPFVTWNSSDTAVATVDQNGNVTAVSAGTATVTATSADNTGAIASCAVTVSGPNAAVSIGTSAPTSNSVAISGPTVYGSKGTAASFTSTYSGTSPVYRWSLDGVPLSDNSYVAGSGTASLTLNIKALAISNGKHWLGLNATDTNNIVYSGTRSFSVVSKLSVAYVTNADGGSSEAYGIYGYTIDPGSGTLTTIPGAPFTTGTDRYPYAPSIDPLGRFAYIPCTDTSTIAAYLIDQGTGALAKIGSYSTGYSPKALAIDPAGKFLYAVNANGGNVTEYTIDQGTGVLTAMGSIGASYGGQIIPMALAIAPSGNFLFFVDNLQNKISTLSIDSGTGVLSNTGPTPSTGSGPASVKVDTSGAFAYVGCGDGTVWAYSIAATTGALTLIGSYASDAGTNSLAIDPAGKFVLATNNYSTTAHSVTSFAINPGSGALTLVGNYTNPYYPESIAVDGTGSYAFVANYGTTTSVSSYSIDTATGALTSLGSLSLYMAGHYTDPNGIVTAYIP
jgi:6-phosphogluconolactonase (cycloisomerase 2 family)